MTLTRTCCCGVTDCTCCFDECPGSLASSYTVGISGQYATDTSAAIPTYDTCGNPFSVTYGVSGLIASAGNAGGCGFPCGQSDYPPFVSNHRACHYIYGDFSSSQPSWSFIASSTGTCSFPTNADCSNFSGAYAGATDKDNLFQWACGTGLACINEVNTNTGLDIWYWVLSLKFTSTATVYNGPVNPPLPEVTFEWYAKSDTSNVCGPPTGRTWYSSSTSADVANAYWYNLSRNSSLDKRTLNPGFPADFCFRNSSDLGAPDSSLTVSIT